MNSIGRWFRASAVVVGTAIYPQISLAESFDGTEFLQQTVQERRGYISTQLVMASSIAARIKPSLADCIGQIFFDDQGMSDTGFNAVIARIEEFKEYHPSSVIVVVIENQCEPFN